MAEKPQLKPCPLCGSNDLYEGWCDNFHIKCLDCSVEMTDIKSEVSCAKKCNKRTFTTTEK